jgi:hypothetical protein
VSLLAVDRVNGYQNVVPPGLKASTRETPKHNQKAQQLYIRLISRNSKPKMATVKEVEPDNVISTPTHFHPLGSSMRSCCAIQK